MADKRLKTAPEIENLILWEMRKAAICASVSAVTVVPVAGRADTNWDVAHINVPGGGAPPQVCVGICKDAVERLRRDLDLLLEIEGDEL